MSKCSGLHRIPPPQTPEQKRRWRCPRSLCGRGPFGGFGALSWGAGISWTYVWGQLECSYGQKLAGASFGLSLGCSRESVSPRLGLLQCLWCPLERQALVARGTCVLKFHGTETIAKRLPGRPPPPGHCMDSGLKGTAEEPICLSWSLGLTGRLQVWAIFRPADG